MANDLTFRLFGIDVNASKSLEKLGATAAATGAELDGLGEATAGAGVAAGAAVAAVAAAAAIMGATTTVMAGNFQAAMYRIHTQAGLPAAAIASLSDKVLALAGDIGMSPDSLAAGLYHIESNFASVGITGQKAMELLRVAAEGAKIGGSDLVDTTNALDATVASGIPGAENYAQAMGTINAMVGAGDMSMQDFADSMSNGSIPIVKLYGVNLMDAAAALATFGDMNVRGADAGTQLRLAVQSLAVPAKAGAKELDALGLKATTLRDAMAKHGLNGALQELVAHLKAAHVPANQVGAILTEVFGKKAGPGLAILVGNMARFESKFKDISKASHGFTKDWADQQTLWNQKWDQFKTKLEVVGIKIGNWLIPIIEKFATWIGDNVPRMWAAFLNTMRPVTDWITGKLIPALRQLWSTDLTHLQSAMASVNDVFARHPETARLVMEALKALGKVLVAVANFIVDHVIPATADMTAFFLDTLGPALDATITMFENVQNAIFDLVQGFLNFVGIFVDGAAKAFGWIPGIGPKLTAAAAEFDAFRDNVNAALAGIMDQSATFTLQFETRGAPPPGTPAYVSRLYDNKPLPVGFASGGNPPVGMPVLVGEHGPELVTFNTPAHVWANGATPTGGFGGGGTTYVQNITVNVPNSVIGDERLIARTVAQAFRKSGNRGYSPSTLDPIF